MINGQIDEVIVINNIHTPWDVLCIAAPNGIPLQAIGTFTECINSGIDESWVRVYHLCYWELLWCYR